MSGEHYVFHCAFHGAHLLWGGSQECQRPNTLLHAGVAKVATTVFLSVALQGWRRKKEVRKQPKNKDFLPKKFTELLQLSRDNVL